MRSIHIESLGSLQNLKSSSMSRRLPQHKDVTAFPSDWGNVDPLLTADEDITSPMGADVPHYAVKGGPLLFVDFFQLQIVDDDATFLGACFDGRKYRDVRNGRVKLTCFFGWSALHQGR